MAAKNVSLSHRFAGTLGYLDDLLAKASEAVKGYLKEVEAYGEMADRSYLSFRDKEDVRDSIISLERLLGEWKEKRAVFEHSVSAQRAGKMVEEGKLCSAIGGFWCAFEK